MITTETSHPPPIWYFLKNDADALRNDFSKTRKPNSDWSEIVFGGSRGLLHVI